MRGTDGRSYLDCMSGRVIGYGDEEIRGLLRQTANNDGQLAAFNLEVAAYPALLAKMLCQNSFADKVHFCATGDEALHDAFEYANDYAYHAEAERRYENPSMYFESESVRDEFHVLAFSQLQAVDQFDRHPLEESSLIVRARPKVRFAQYNDLDSAHDNMDDSVCAIYVEPLQFTGGLVKARPEFLRGLRDLADRHDALLIFDERLGGMGRTGYLWSHQAVAEGAVIPDMMILSDSLAGGLPIGAVCMNERVSASLASVPYREFPISAPVACTVLHRVAQPQFLESVESKGRFLEELLKEKEWPDYDEGEIQRQGLVVDIPFLDFWGSSAHDLAKAGLLVDIVEGQKRIEDRKYQRRGVLRFNPPLCIAPQELEWAVETLGRLGKKWKQDIEIEMEFALSTSDPAPAVPTLFP